MPTRHKVLRTLDGVTEVQARTRPLPHTTLTVGGIAKHLALVEDPLFNHKLLGDPKSDPWGSVPAQERDWTS